MKDYLYEISINGAAPVDVEELGLQLGALTERHLACSTLTLTQPRAIGEPLLLAAEDAIKLYINGRCVFVGETTKNPEHSYEDGGTATTYTVQNWWRRMERQPWTRGPAGRVEVGEEFFWPFDGMTYIMGWTDSNATSPLTRSTNRFYSAKTFQFGGGVDPYTSSSVAVTGNLLFIYLLDRHPGLITPPAFPWTIGLWDPKTYVISDASLAQAMQGVMRMEPAGIMRTSYEGGTPVVEVLDGAIQPVRTFALGEQPLKGATLTPMGDLIPKGISIRISSELFRADYGRGFQNLSDFFTGSLCWWPASTRPDDYEVMNMSTEQSDTNLEVNYGNVALKFYEQISVLTAEGQMVFDDPGMELKFQLGQQVAVSGDGDVEHGRGLVQEITHRFADMTTICRVGYPGPLGLSDLISRDEWARRTLWGGGRPSSLAKISPV